MKSFLLPYATGFVRVRGNPHLEIGGLRGFRKKLFTAFDVEFRQARELDEGELAFKLRLRRRRLVRMFLAYAGDWLTIF